MVEEQFVISELIPKSILNMNTGDTYPIEDEGIFETVCGLLNNQQKRIQELEKKNERLEMKINRERNATEKQYKKWKKEAELKIMRLELEVEMLRRMKISKKIPESINVIIKRGDVE